MARGKKGKVVDRTNHNVNATRYFNNKKVHHKGGLDRGEKVTKSKRSTADTPQFKSRREAVAVSINTNGRTSLGYQPKYKLQIIVDFLSTIPDVICIQDSLDYSDMTDILEKASSGTYEVFFQETSEDSDQKSDKENSESIVRSVTGVAWNKDKYWGSPLQFDDKRLKEYIPWLRAQNMTVVKLDSKETVDMEDVYPSFIVISWHGSDYEIPLKHRFKECEEFFAFLTLLRGKNWNIPILIGGHFNMNMQSFNMKSYPDFGLASYRPVSGTLAKDLKNLFIFTTDSLQITETGYKHHHPETFPNPFISSRVRSKNQIKIWAVVKIQRAIRRWLNRRNEREEAKHRLKENKKRWKKKIEGDNYKSEDENDDRKRDGRRYRSKSRDRRNNDYYNDDKDKSRYPEEKERRTNLGFRRQKYSELKSIHQRKKENEGNEFLYRDLDY